VPKKNSSPPIILTHPELAKEANGWNPSDLTFGSHELVNWRCKQNHTWQASPNARIKRNGKVTLCPFCSNKKAKPGFNDLATTHPDIAKEADGWDPSTITFGSGGVRNWKCSNGHTYAATVNSRTSKNTPCTICSGHKLIIGVNDLSTTNPELAKEAFCWDPTKFRSGSKSKKEWKCSLGHIFEATIHNRVFRNSTCSYCSGRKVLQGFNDLATTHPDIAKEADGWDPTKFSKGSRGKKNWICSKGHTWTANLTDRTGTTRRHRTICPDCSGKRLLQGFNDLQTRFPEIAKEAFGWDPAQITFGSAVKREWKCPMMHIYSAAVQARTRVKSETGKSSGCPYCSGNKLLIGFNDLKTKRPDLALEAFGWDPSKINFGSGSIKWWICKDKQVSSRSQPDGSNCPTCAPSGFRPGEDGYIYFLSHPNWEMYQIGITNRPEKRLLSHKHSGWELIELRGPMDGNLTTRWETSILRMLKAKGADLANSKIAGKFDGYSEAWSKSAFPVKSIKELMQLTEEYEESLKS
jgi:hypothetical protein